jgi:hypothetical protein
LDIDTDTTEGTLQQEMTLILADIINQQGGTNHPTIHVYISLESQGKRRRKARSIDDTKPYVTVHTESQQKLLR